MVGGQSLREMVLTERCWFHSFFREFGLKGEFYFGTKTQPPSFITWFSVAGGVLSSIGHFTRGQSKVTGPFVEVLSQELRNPIRQEGF